MNSLSLRKRLSAHVIALIIITTGAVYSGLVYDAFLWLWEPLKRSITRLDWWSGFAVGLAVGASIAGMIARWLLLRAHASRDIAVKLNELDDTLVRSIPELALPHERPAKLKRLVHEVLRDCARIFGRHVLRGMILRVEDDYLVPWVSYEMSITTMEHARFYIGSDPERRRGIAGEAY